MFRDDCLIGDGDSFDGGFDSLSLCYCMACDCGRDWKCNERKCDCCGCRDATPEEERAAEASLARHKAWLADQVQEVDVDGMTYAFPVHQHGRMTMEQRRAAVLEWLEGRHANRGHTGRALRSGR